MHPAFVVVLVLVAGVSLTLLLRPLWDRWRTPDRDYAALHTKEMREEAIAGARSPRELDAMWDAWKSAGLSPEGLTYAALLQKKAELGVSLDETEKETIRRADAAWKHGKGLSPVRGRGRL